jgi:hypothetical protein
MPLQTASTAPSRDRIAALPQGWRHHLWLALLVVASVAFSLGFACATPFVAFAAGAALTLGRRDALMLIVAVWLANQFVGFAWLGYPGTANTLAWGLALGAAAILATLAAQEIAARAAGSRRAARATVAFLAAFAVYEGVLFVLAVALLGGTEDFTPTIIGEIFAINAAALLGLFAVSRIGAAIGLAAAPAMPFAASERHA